MKPWDTGFWKSIIESKWNGDLEFGENTPMAHVYDCKHREWRQVISVNCRNRICRVSDGNDVVRTQICHPIVVHFFGEGSFDTMLVADDVGFYLGSRGVSKVCRW